ncbi:hypothetical protein ACFL40_04795 [candidate division KSB1 bacterium]
MKFKKKSVNFLKSKKYKYISKFAESYKDKYKYFSEGDEYYDKTIEKKIGKLKKSLDKEGFAFDIIELKTLIHNEIIVLSYRDFKLKINKFHPKDFKEYITAFLKLFGEEYKEFINYYHFKLLLSEQGVEYREYTLKDEIMDVKRDLSL